MGHELLGGEGELKEEASKLFLPKALDEDIRRRLTIEAILEVVKATEMGAGWRRLYEKVLPERYASGWSTAEVNYLLYGKDTSTGLECSGFNFLYYGFFHYVNPNDPKDANGRDICYDDPVAPHRHSFLSNPDKVSNRGKRVLGFLHSHPFGFSVTRKWGTVESVGFSGPDREWNGWYLKKYGGDGRSMAFVIYNQGWRGEPDFYKGIEVSRNIAPKHLEIAVR